MDDSAAVRVLARLAVITRARTATLDLTTEARQRLRARVEVEMIGGGVLYRESGAWEDGRRTMNVLRFLVDDDAIEIAHMRRGSATALVRMTRCGRLRWESGEPHLCGRDTYAAVLRVFAGGVALRWRIDGPAKRMRITTLYF